MDVVVSTSYPLPWLAAALEREDAAVKSVTAHAHRAHGAGRKTSATGRGAAQGPFWTLGRDPRCSGADPERAACLFASFALSHACLPGLLDSLQLPKTRVISRLFDPSEVAVRSLVASVPLCGAGQGYRGHFAPTPPILTTKSRHLDRKWPDFAVNAGWLAAFGDLAAAFGFCAHESRRTTSFVSFYSYTVLRPPSRKMAIS